MCPFVLVKGGKLRGEEGSGFGASGLVEDGVNGRIYQRAMNGVAVRKDEERKVGIFLRRGRWAMKGCPGRKHDDSRVRSTPV